MEKKKMIDDLYKKIPIGSIYVFEEDSFYHYYDVVHDEADEEIQIFYSKSDEWTDWTKGKKTGSIASDGDNIKIKIDNKIIKLDHAQMEVLTALILSSNETRMELRQNKVISSISALNETL